MNDKDKKAFEKWKLEYISTHTGYFKMIGTDDLAQVVWESACDYKEIKTRSLQSSILILQEKTLVIGELEKKLTEALNGTLLKRYNQEKEDALEKLNVAVEALEYMGTYKHPDYMSYGRGSIFEVAKVALEKIKEK